MKKTYRLLSIFLFLPFSAFLYAKTDFSKRSKKNEPLYKYDKRYKSQKSISLGLSQPSFLSDKPLYYSTVYNDNLPLEPSLRYTHFFSGQKFFLVGFGGQVSLLNESGHAQQKVDGTDTLKDASNLTLNVLPYQIFTQLRLDLFPNHHIILDLSVGYEELYFEESRDTRSTRSDEISDSQDSLEKPYAKGWNSSYVFSVALGFRLNFLDERSAISLKDTLKLGGIYLSTFYEVRVDTKQETLLGDRAVGVIDFTRQNIGLAFTYTTM